MKRLKAWLNERKARKRIERIAANKRGIESGLIFPVGLGASGLDIGGSQAYTVDGWDYFYFDEDGFTHFFWSKAEEIR